MQIFVIEANTFNPDQGAVWSRFKLFAMKSTQLAEWQEESNKSTIKTEEQLCAYQYLNTWYSIQLIYACL